MRIAKGARSALKAFAPSVMLEVGAEGWRWGSPELEELRARAARVAGDRWELHGPAVLRDGYCVVRFDAPAEKPPPPPTKLVSALEDLPGLDGVVVDVPSEDRRLVGLRSTRGCVMLRAFQRAEGTGGEVPAGWVETALAAVEDRSGSPAAVAFGSFRSSVTDGTSRAAGVLEGMGAEGLPCAVVWFPKAGGGVAAGTTGGGAFQVAAFGAAATDDIVDTAAWLRELGVRLAGVAEPAYARVSIEPTGLGAFSVSSRSQPGAPASPNTSVTERRLGKWVPDAYWWQVLDRHLVDGLSGAVATSSVSDNLVEVVFGDVVEWLPATSWPGDADAPAHVDPPEVLTNGRTSLKPLLWSF